MKRQRLEKEHDRLHGEWDVRNALLTRLGQALIIETDTNVKFKLEKQIQYEQEQQKQLENRLNEIEQSLNSPNPQVSNQALPLPQRSNAQISSLSSPVSECQYRILDYRNLRDLLYAEKWREANKETWELMLKVTNRERHGWIDSDSFKIFSCKDLLIIDRLWINGSEGHFGFSVQMKIWEECGCPIQNNDDWRKFLDRIGWCDEGKYNPSPKFNLAISPLGELPLSIDVASYQAWDASGQRRWDGISFFQRLLNCSKF